MNQVKNTLQVKKSEPPILYLYVYGMMARKFGTKNYIVPVCDILEVWRRNIHNIPRRYEPTILKEFEEYGFIEKINDSRRYKFNGANAQKRLKEICYFLW